MGSECSSEKHSKSHSQAVYTLKYNFSPTESVPPIPTPPSDPNSTATASRKSWQAAPATAKPKKQPWKPDADLSTRRDPDGKFATKLPFEPQSKSNEFATFSPVTIDECSNFTVKPQGHIANVSRYEDENTPDVSQPIEDEDEMPAMNQPRISVDYRDLTQAREELKQRLEREGQARPLENGEMMEVMHRNKRKKTQIKGGEGRTEYESQQKVATLVQQFTGKPGKK